MTITPDNATPIGQLRQRIDDLETLRDRVDDELTVVRRRLARIVGPPPSNTPPPGVPNAEIRAWGRAQG